MEVLDNSAPVVNIAPYGEVFSVGRGNARRSAVKRGRDAPGRVRVTIAYGLVLGDSPLLACLLTLPRLVVSLSGQFTPKSQRFAPGLRRHVLPGILAGNQP